MDLLLFFAGLFAGGILAWYLVGQRYRQTHISRVVHEEVNKKLIEAGTALTVASERAMSLDRQLSEASASRKEKEDSILKQSSEIATLTSELGTARKRTEEALAERISVQTAHELLREKNEDLKSSLAKAEAQLEARTESLKSANEEGELLREEVRIVTKKANQLNEQLANMQAQKNAADENLQTQKSEIEAIQKRMATEFENLAMKILEDKSERFTALNKSNLESILKPLGDNIEGFRKKVDEVYEKESQQRFSLGEKVAELVALNQQISVDATNLTRALEGSSKTQGDWGEMILERILEQSGLEKGREYVVQEFLRDEDGTILKNEDGSKMQPDVVVSYPDNRKVIIDSKVSLIAYKRYAVAETKEDQESALKLHVESIKRHIDGLSRRNYPDFTQSLDFVMMFVPIEPAFLVAMHHDPELWHYAYTKRVLLISPTNLIAALKLVSDLWKREDQNRHAIEIAESGGALYDKFVGFVDALGDIETHLGRAQKSHANAMNMLKDGNGNLLRRVQKLKKLGAKAKKSLPSSLLQESDMEILAEEDSKDSEDEGARQDNEE